MAKKRKIDEVGTQKPKLDLWATLGAIDCRNFTYYDSLPDDEKKLYGPFILMRWISSTPDQNGLHEYHIKGINDYVNKHFWSLSKYPDLQHMLMCSIGIGSKQRHNWIAKPKEKSSSSKLVTFLKTVHQGINDQELGIVLDNLSEQDFEELTNDWAVEPKEAKELLKSFKKTKDGNVSED